MKDNTELNLTNESDEERPDESLEAHTPQQRRTIAKGLRILARVAIRSYMREHGGAPQAESGRDAEEG